MNELSPNTPVIIGTGFCQEKLDDPAASAEPYRLMVNAIRQAAQDAGATALAAQLESIAVLKGMWEYRNPGRLIATELGCPRARSILADVGNLQLSPLFDLCAAIRAGEQQLGAVTGGEEKFRELRAKITGQAAAVLVCSVAKARALGLDESRWIYPLAATQNRHVVVLAQKRRLHTQPGTVIAGERACALAGVTARDVSMAELYSCFPAAVRCFARDLALDGACPLSVTGSMAFAGGLFNHAALDGVVGMTEALRREPPTKRCIGLVANLSGIFGKQAVLLLANRPGNSGFAFEDVTAQVAAIGRHRPVDPCYHGPARIIGYTVAFAKNEPSHAYAYCENAAGARTVARSADPELIRQMTEREFVGREVLVHEDNSFSRAPG